MTWPDVAVLLVGVLNRDDGDTGHVLAVHQLGVVVARQDVGALPTVGPHLVALRPVLHIVTGAVIDVHGSPPRRLGLGRGDLGEVVPQLEPLCRLGLLKVVLVAVALPEPARETISPSIAPL